MALDPNTKSALTTFTMAAKGIIYNAERMKIFMRLLGTPAGAVTAVQSVLAGIQRHRPIPADLAPMLAVNAYLVMVDVAQAATKHPPSAEVMKKVISMILDKKKPRAAVAPQGIIGRAAA